MSASSQRLTRDMRKIAFSGATAGRVVGAVAGGALGAASAPKDGTATPGGTAARIAGGALLGGAAGGHIGGSLGKAGVQAERAAVGAPPIPQAAAKPGQVLSQSHIPTIAPEHVQSYAPGPPPRTAAPPPRAAAPPPRAAPTTPNAIAYEQSASLPQGSWGAAPSAPNLQPPSPVNKPWYRRRARVVPEQVTAEQAAQMKLGMARRGTMNSAMINGFSDELQQIHKVANNPLAPFMGPSNWGRQADVAVSDELGKTAARWSRHTTGTYVPPAVARLVRGAPGYRLRSLISHPSRGPASERLKELAKHELDFAERAAKDVSERAANDAAKRAAKDAAKRAAKGRG